MIWHDCSLDYDDCAMRMIKGGGREMVFKFEYVLVVLGITQG